MCLQLLAICTSHCVSLTKVLHKSPGRGPAARTPAKLLHQKRQHVPVQLTSTKKWLCRTHGPRDMQTPVCPGPCSYHSYYNPNGLFTTTLLRAEAVVHSHNTTSTQRHHIRLSFLPLQSATSCQPSASLQLLRGTAHQSTHSWQRLCGSRHEQGNSVQAMGGAITIG